MLKCRVRVKSCWYLTNLLLYNGRVVVLHTSAGNKMKFIRMNNVFLFLMPITDLSGKLPSSCHVNYHLDGNRLIPEQAHAKIKGLELTQHIFVLIFSDFYLISRHCCFHLLVSGYNTTSCNQHVVKHSLTKSISTGCSALVVPALGHLCFAFWTIGTAHWHTWMQSSHN